MGFSSIIDSEIEVSDTVAGRSNFGTPMLVGYHTKSVDRVITVGSSADAITDFGFSRSNGTDAVWLAKMDQFFAQKPRPKELKLGRCALGLTQVYTLSVGTVAVGDTVKITFDGTAISIPVDGSTVAATPTAVASALVTAINAVHAGRAASTVGVVTVTGSAAGVLYKFADWNRFITLKSTSTDPGIATDLDNILVEDEEWITFDLVDDGEASVKAAAAWAETNQKLFVPTVSDTECRTSATTDVLSDLKALALDNTMATWTGLSTFDARGLALFGMVAAFYNPGAATFAHKGLALTVADTKTTLRRGEIAYLEGKNGNFYAPYRKVDTTWEGKAASGDYFDISLGRLWLNDEIGASVFEAVRGAPGKLSFDNDGIATMQSGLDATLKTAADADHKLLDLGSIEITVVKAEDMTSTERQSRVYDGFSWSARFQGAIHAGVIRGKVSF